MSRDYLAVDIKFLLFPRREPLGCFPFSSRALANSLFPRLYARSFEREREGGRKIPPLARRPLAELISFR